jgi:hypothetical protein
MASNGRGARSMSGVGNGRREKTQDAAGRRCPVCGALIRHGADCPGLSRK